MSGLGSSCLTLIPSKFRFADNYKPPVKVRGRSFLQQKYRARTSVRAEMRGEGQCVFGNLTIQGIPHINEVVKRQSQNLDAFRKPEYNLDEAYRRCAILSSKQSILFVLGTLALSKKRRRALWALYAWCRRLDELVDSPNISDDIRSASLDEWEERTKDIFDRRPHDILDAALVDTISKFPLDIEPFQEMIKGMRMDITKKRYANFEELLLYSFSVAGTVGLMIVPVFGIAPESSVSFKAAYDGAVYLMVAGHLTDILRDVSDDAQLGRIYLPQDELAQFGLCDEDVLSRKVTDGWREFMKKQIQRARFYFDEAERGLSQIDKSNRCKLWLAARIYKLSLNAIEMNNYDNLTKKPMGMSV